MRLSVKGYLCSTQMLHTNYLYKPKFELSFPIRREEHSYHSNVVIGMFKVDKRGSNERCLFPPLYCDKFSLHVI